MQTTFALAALAAVAFAAPAPQAPSASAPAGCQTSYDGEFQITIVNGSSTMMTKRQSTCGQEGLLTAKLTNGVLTDNKGRTGSIVSNRQFQFDAEGGQAGAVYTSGWSVCQNGSLTIGDNSLFYSCASGDFSNLYDQNVAPQCLPVYIDVLPCGGAGGAVEQPDGQPGATVVVPPVSQKGDGQPQATGVVTQIGDGQLQAPTNAPMPPVTQIADGQLQAGTAAIPVTQIADGQLQAGAPVTQIGDGQVQAPTTAGGPAVTQIGDGQVQAPTGAPPATQIGDGQVQVPTGAPVTQIGDGQIQAPTSASGPAVTQIPDGQLQTNTTTPITVPANAGNSLNIAGSMASVVVALGAVLLL